MTDPHPVTILEYLGLLWRDKVWVLGGALAALAGCVAFDVVILDPPNSRWQATAVVWVMPTAQEVRARLLSRSALRAAGGSAAASSYLVERGGSRQDGGFDVIVTSSSREEVVPLANALVARVMHDVNEERKGGEWTGARFRDPVTYGPPLRLIDAATDAAPVPSKRVYRAAWAGGSGFIFSCLAVWACEGYRRMTA